MKKANKISRRQFLKGLAGSLALSSIPSLGFGFSKEKSDRELLSEGFNKHYIEYSSGIKDRVKNKGRNFLEVEEPKLRRVEDLVRQNFSKKNGEIPYLVHGKKDRGLIFTELENKNSKLSENLENYVAGYVPFSADLEKLFRKYSSPLVNQRSSFSRIPWFDYINSFLDKIKSGEGISWEERKDFGEVFKNNILDNTATILVPRSDIILNNNQTAKFLAMAHVHEKGEIPSAEDLGIPCPGIVISHNPSNHDSAKIYYFNHGLDSVLKDYKYETNLRRDFKQRYGDVGGRIQFNSNPKIANANFRSSNGLRSLVSVKDLSRIDLNERKDVSLKIPIKSPSDFGTGFYLIGSQGDIYFPEQVAEVVRF